MRPKFTLSTLIALVALCAAVLGSMPPLDFDPWMFVVIPGALAILGSLNCGILEAIFRRAAARAFWLGFTLFGWTSFLLLSILVMEWPQGMLIVLPFAWIGGLIGRGLWIAAQSDVPPKSGAAPPISYETPEDSPDGRDPLAPAGRLR